MNTTFQNSAQVLSIGIFFTLMIVGLSASLPRASTTGSSPTGCRRRRPPGSRTCRPSRPCLRPSSATTRCSTWSGRAFSPTSRGAAGRAHRSGFFPSIITAPFRSGLHAALDFALVASLLAAAASWTRGGRQQHTRLPSAVSPARQPEGGGQTRAAGGAEDETDLERVATGVPSSGVPGR